MTNDELAKQLMNQPPQGWQCPVCKKVHAPHAASCDCHRKKTKSEAIDVSGFIDLLNEHIRDTTT